MRAAHLGCLAALAWLPEPASGGKKITFEILPDDAGDGGPSSASLYGDFQEMISHDRSSLAEYGQLAGLATGVDDMTVIPDKDHAAVDIVADGKIRATSQADVDISAAGGLIGRFVEPVDMVAGGASLRTAGNMTAAVAGASLQAAGDLAAHATGAADLAALSIKARLSDALDLQAGGNVSMSSGADVSVLGRGDANAAFGGDLHISGAGMRIEGSEGLTAITSSVDVRGRDGVRVAAAGADFSLGGDGEVEYVAFIWRSSASFDEYENAVPKITGVQELVVTQRQGHDNPVARVRHGTQLRMDMAAEQRMSDGGSGAVWTEGVWSSLVGDGEYSLNGLRVRLPTPMDVVAVRLTSDPFNNPSYQGWSEVMFHFGRLSAPGTMALRAAGRIEATAEESLSMHTRQLVLDANNMSLTGDSVDVRSSGRMAVQTAGALEAHAEEIHLHSHEDLSVYSGGAASTMAHTVQLDAQADATVRAGGTLSVVSEQAALELGGKLALSGKDAEMKIEGALDVYAAQV